MKAASIRLLGFCPALLLMATATVLSAQEVIPVSESEIGELAILFAPAAPIGSTDGDRVPATVISSPEASSTLHSWFDGVLTQWHVAPGDNIEAGTLIATLRSEELLSAKRALLDATIDQARCEAALTRDQNLFDAGVIAAARLDETRRQHQQGVVATTALTQRLLSAGISTADIDNLTRTQQATGTYAFRADRSGTLVRRLVQVGDYVADGSAVAALKGQGLPWLRASVPVYLASGLSPGQTMRTVERDSELQLHQIDQQIDLQSQTIGILAQFTASNDWIPGQTLTLILPAVSAGILVPASAVVFNGEDTTIYVRHRDGFEARTLALQTTGRNYLATDGISAGEELVIQGTAVLKGIQLGLGGTE